LQLLHQFMQFVPNDPAPDETMNQSWWKNFRVDGITTRPERTFEYGRNAFRLG